MANCSDKKNSILYPIQNSEHSESAESVNSRNNIINGNVLRWHKLSSSIKDIKNELKNGQKIDTSESSIFYSNSSNITKNRDINIDKDSWYFLEKNRVASVLYKNCIYIFGGYIPKERLNHFYKYDIIENKWIKMINNNCLLKSEHNSAFLYNNKMYILCEYNGKRRWSTDLYFFDFNKEIWEIMKIKKNKQINNRYCPPSTLFGFSISVDDVSGLLYIFGGYNGKYLSNELYILNLNHKNWIKAKQSGEIPNPRTYAISHIFDGYFYIFGGYNGDSCLNSFYEYHIKSGIWSKVKYNMDTEISNKNSNEDNKSIIKSLNDQKKKTKSYTYCNNKEDKVPMARCLMGSFLYNKSIYILGGYNNNFCGNLYDFYKYNIHERTWEKLTTRNNCSQNNLNVHFYKNVIYSIGKFNEKNILNNIYALKLENIYVAPSGLLDHYKGMVNNSLFADVVFILQDQHIYGCRNILSSRCLYFKSLFNIHISEKNKNIIINGMNKIVDSNIHDPMIYIPINDINYDIFLIIIDYLYTDNLPTDFTLEMYIQILILAINKFHLFRLAQLCEQAITNKIDRYNVFNILFISYRNNSKQLCKFCIDFIMHNNLLDKEKINMLTLEPHLLGEFYKKSLYSDIS
ncbi:hypothetical protein YYC_00709 [Plasmodium yoelii 17X]|uniref:Kelch domain-containing protein n=5 Tax=Plasmodium yoelii TaxID=5861 RepID=A0AAF0B7Z6_PLAYO|nr:uncharacterized protein PY17X_1327600 [Plasmodium yoelii]EAA21123.1 Drosophila melanogaster LP01394p [Plasmodium yoelii yoelii]ETB63125.1 hypothetical protein YYC_00709 [Plasmodium yoelii 17X]WBY59955.1 kelch domain-containing protein [Plasmodium yoelii yoelii]CDU19896.1 conserved Plasmodium protein, unknown function [Plasmodium yoelii]VTZ80653.1 kelch domain-containing protein, putative [Plasmodium yoelii]|eukprot:XP_729558.1 uncharacterized protein PY17X_1327600 [Plasmodium yoelii]